MVALGTAPVLAPAGDKPPRYGTPKQDGALTRAGAVATCRPPR